VSETQRLLPMPSYRDLLYAAYTLGRADGQLAADLESLESAGATGACCRGSDHAEFARQLWDLPFGDPPAGLEVNAPHWYAHGFHEALAEVRTDHDHSSSQLASGSIQPSTASAVSRP
jgi:hypothetical protein